MQDLMKNMGASDAGDAEFTSNAGSADDASSAVEADFSVNIIEGQASGDIVFCIRTGIVAEDLNVSALCQLLAQNQPLSGSPPSVIGLHPEDGDIFLWCRAAAESLELPECVEILKRLVHQADELKNGVLATSGCRDSAQRTV
ncbi:MAG: Tir chaperone protein (CesT) family [Herbaspirillum sp.]|nr:Tir chaperone protein (CesT) family [Herbaspirillum sp.]